MKYVVGSWYETSRTVYVYINEQGTVRKLGKVKWYKILALVFLQALGKKKSLSEVLEFFNRRND